MKAACCPFTGAFQKYGAEIAVVTDKENISYDQLSRSANNARHRLEAAGLKPNSRAAILGVNSPEYVVVLLALWRMKAVACLLSTRTPPQEIPHQLDALNCQALITSDEISDDVWSDNSKKLRMSDLVCPGVIARSSPKACDEAISEIASPQKAGLAMTPLDQDATIMFTSGSTATPKAVVHTIGNHYYNAKGSNENIPVDTATRWLLSLPLYHVGGLSILFRVLSGGGTVVIPPPQEDLAASIKNHSVTHLSVVTTQLARLLRNTKNAIRDTRLKAILLGGSAIPDTLIQKAEEYQLPLFTTYGLTEMASQVATTPSPFPLPLRGRGPGRGGKVLKYRQVQISDDNEILVKGETLFRGYWQNNTLIAPFTPEGWFKTGDLGCLDKEGYLTVTGRKDNMFISGGENIYPEEIERQLLNLDAVEQALVVAAKDEEFGSRPVAFIKFKNGQTLSENEIITALRKHLASFKVPRCFYPWPETRESGIKTSRQYFEELL